MGKLATNTENLIHCYVQQYELVFTFRLLSKTPVYSDRRRGAAHRVLTLLSPAPGALRWGEGARESSPPALYAALLIWVQVGFICNNLVCFSKVSRQKVQLYHFHPMLYCFIATHCLGSQPFSVPDPSAILPVSTQPVLAQPPSLFATHALKCSVRHPRPTWTVFVNYTVSRRH